MNKSTAIRNTIPTREDSWVRWSRLVFVLFVSAVLLGSLTACDDSHTARSSDKAKGYTPYVYIDGETGCHYLATYHDGALTPRMDRNGKQVCL